MAKTVDMFANKTDAEVAGAAPQPVQAVRSLARVPPQVRAVPRVLPPARAARRHPRRHQVELVNRCMHVNDRSNRGFPRPHPQRHPGAPGGGGCAASSKLKQRLAEVLKDEGYIAGYDVRDDDNGLRRDRGPPALGGPTHQRHHRPAPALASRPAHVRPSRHASPRSAPAWASRSSPPRKGLMTDRAARKEGLGGELLCEVW